MIRVLVTGVGGRGIGEGIVKALKMAGGYEIYATDIDPFAPALYRVKAGFLVPRANAKKYLFQVKKILANFQIEVLIPGSNEETIFLSNNKEKFNSVFLAVDQPQVVNVCSDGWLTHHFLLKNGFSSPPTYLSEDWKKCVKERGFPLIIKPRKSHGSKNVYRVHDEESLTFYLNLLARGKIPAIIQQSIGLMENEYTIGVLRAKEGHIISTVILKRILEGGASVKMETVEDPLLEKLAQKVVSELNAYGPINIQCRKQGKDYYIFEINPRFSGTTPVRAALGVNEPDLMIKNYYLNQKIPFQNPKNSVVISRAFQEVYIEEGVFKKLKKTKVVKNGGGIVDYL